MRCYSIKISSDNVKCTCDLSNTTNVRQLRHFEYGIDYACLDVFIVSVGGRRKILQYLVSHLRSLLDPCLALGIQCLQPSCTAGHYSDVRLVKRC